MFPLDVSDTRAGAHWFQSGPSLTVLICTGGTWRWMCNVPVRAAQSVYYSIGTFYQVRRIGSATG
jgi:hypothetical protein